MKSTGIVRKLDQLGRLVLPIELHRVLEINDRDPIEILVDDGKELFFKSMFLRKPACFADNLQISFIITSRYALNAEKS